MPMFRTVAPKPQRILWRHGVFHGCSFPEHTKNQQLHLTSVIVFVNWKAEFHRKNGTPTITGVFGFTKWFSTGHGRLVDIFNKLPKLPFGGIFFRSFSLLAVKSLSQLVRGRRPSGIVLHDHDSPIRLQWTPVSVVYPINVLPVLVDQLVLDR